MAAARTLFVQNVSVGVLLLIILSWLWHWVKEGSSRLRVYYFAGSACGKACARYLNRVRSVEVKEADYSWAEVRNSDDQFCHSRVSSHDAICVWRSARVREIERNAFLVRLSRRFDRNRLLLYVAKCVDEEVRWRLFQMNVVEWLRRRDRIGEKDPVIYYAGRSCWSEYPQGYAPHD